jgi:hypothetical protein
VSAEAAELCCVCHRAEATRLCDYVLGRILPRGKRARITNDVWPTCDAPLCDGCTVVVGHTLFCGEGGGIETHDRCPAHDGVERSRQVLTHAEAETLRARARIRTVPSEAT